MGGMPGAARPNIGPVTPSQPHAGTNAAAINDIHNAVVILEKALPSLPIGSELHTEVLQATTKLAKHLGQGGTGGEGLQMNSLLQMMRQASQQAPMAALNRMGGGATPSMGGSPGGPAMPMAA